MEIKDYVKQFRDLQKSHKKVRVADFCRENMLDYYEMVEALKQEKFEMESYEEQVQCGDLVITEIPESNESTQPMPSTESYIKEVMLSFPKGLKLTVREITPSDLVTYQARSGSVTRAATVLAELVEKTDFRKYGTAFLKVAPTACFQRLGYILDVVLEESEAADAVYSLLKEALVRLQPAALKPGKATDGCELDSRWKIIVNESIEIDEL